MQRRLSIHNPLDKSDSESVIQLNISVSDDSYAETVVIVISTCSEHTIFNQSLAFKQQHTLCHTVSKTYGEDDGDATYSRNVGSKWDYFVWIA